MPKVQSQRKFLNEINGFFKERQFFTRYCPQLNTHCVNILEDAVPVCHFINEETFIFDDLHAEGYETLSARAPLQMDCIKTALITLAKLHASGLILEEVKSFRLVDDFEEELKESFYLGTDSTEFAMRSCKSGIRALIDLTHRDDMKISKDLFTVKALEGCDLQKTFTKPSTRFRNTVCHADPWTKNFMFKFEEGKAINCVAVDFQTYRYGPPAQDVLAFIHLVTDRDFRSRHMNELLHFYYEKLDDNVEKFGFKNVVTKEEFFDSCRYFQQFALTQTITHFQVVILSDEIANELFADPENARFVLFENKYDFFKMVCEKDPLFRKKNFELIDELREFYENRLL
ncbi:EcKinase, DUF1679, and/or APH domain containing protein [Asbolus verrucosus]|uniref:EcKinase, DUF1679, and/or APH domain containing protein n=1 Tax=Asbolus verrucosus TaxID=1661398 RepID=A0A482W342_ASBVE|nr:EcKinase, DUF1679, and/or APH domain containing protein [Asbolus verrucosus]